MFVYLVGRKLSAVVSALPVPAPSLACFAFSPPAVPIELSQTYPEPSVTQLFTGHRRLATKYSQQLSSDTPYYIRRSTLVGTVWSRRESAMLQISPVISARHV